MWKTCTRGIRCQLNLLCLSHILPYKSSEWFKQTPNSKVDEEKQIFEEEFKQHTNMIQYKTNYDAHVRLFCASWWRRKRGR